MPIFRVLIFGLFFVCHALADPPQLSPEVRELGKNLDVGLEIELPERTLANIVDIFNWEAIEIVMKGRDLPMEILDEYILEKEAFQALPEVIKEHLTRGLSLGSVLVRGEKPSSLTLPNDIPNEKKILGPDGNPLNSGPTPIQTRGVAQPELPQNYERHNGVLIKKGTGNTPSNKDWQTLYERWRALDEPAKRMLTKLRYLHPLDKARVLLLDTPPRVPLAIKQHPLFSRFEYEVMFAQGVMEARYIVPRPGLQGALHDLHAVAKHAKIELQVFKPQDLRRFDNAVHLHVSSAAETNSNFKTRVREVNYGMLFRDISEGRYGALFHSVSEGGFSPNERDKGVIRHIDNFTDVNRAELRHHPHGVVDTLNTWIPALFGPDPEKAKKMREFYAQKISPDRWRWLLLNGPRRPLAGIAPFVPKELVTPEFIWELMHKKQYHVAHEIFSHLILDSTWSEQKVADLVEKISQIDPEKGSLDFFVGLSLDPESVAKSIENDPLLKKRVGNILEKLLSSDVKSVHLVGLINRFGFSHFGFLESTKRFFSTDDHARLSEMYRQLEQARTNKIAEQMFLRVTLYDILKVSGKCLEPKLRSGT